MTYQQSGSIQEIQQKHPFPWREQRAGGLVRMVDANSREVVLFEITALATIVTRQLAANKPQSPVNEPQP